MTTRTQSGGASRELTEHAVQTITANLGGGGQSGPSTDQISSAVAELHKAVVNQRNDLNAYMTGADNVVMRHLDETQRLKRHSEAVRSDVEAVGNDFDLQNAKCVPGVADFLKLSAARGASGQDQAVATATLAALKEVKLQYDYLCQIEDAIWSGCSTTDLVLQSFPVSETAGDNPSKVAAAIKNRIALLRSTVSEQLARAWGAAVVVGVFPSAPAISVKRSVRLQLPTISRATPQSTSVSSTPPAYHLSDISAAMSKLNILTDHLQQLHSQIIHHIIDPLLSSKGGKASVSEDASASSLKLVQEGNPRAEDTVRSVQTVLTFVRDTITTAALPELDNFFSHLQQDASARILSGIVMPSIPATSTRLSEWLALVRQCSASESGLTGGTGGLLENFADREAGRQWLNKFRSSRLQRARELSFQTWSTAGVDEVKLPIENVHEVDSTKRQSLDSAPRVSLDSAKAPSPPSASPADDEDDAGGWGFDDDLEPLTRTEPDAPAAPLPNADEDDASGWDFDEPMEVAPPAPVPLKPAREAKRLGKRVSTKAASTRSSPSPPVPSSPLQRTPPPPEPKLAAQAAPVPAPRPAFKVYRVSTACAIVLRLPSEILSEVEYITSLTEPSFKDVPGDMLRILTEELDFICATTPVAQQSLRHSSPAASLQMSNDYLYISHKLSTLETGSAWTAQMDCARRFEAAAKLLELGCLEDQHVAISSALDGARHFVEMSHDSFFHQAEDAIRTVVSRLELLGVDTKRVLDLQQYQEFLGKLVESVVTRLLADVVALDDITEVESERISSLLGQVEALDYLFKAHDSDVSTIAVHVPHWLKFCYMKEILHANLVDITYLFESGSLVDFTPAELSKLVQALFADSAKRSALLAKIG